MTPKRILRGPHKLRRDQVDRHVRKLKQSGHTPAQALANVVIIVQEQFNRPARKARIDQV